MKRAALSLWGFLFCFYSVTGTGHSSFSDGYLLLQTAESLLDRGAMSLPHADETFTVRRGLDGARYARFAPGLAIAHLPVLAAGRTLRFLDPEIDGAEAPQEQRDEFWAQFTNAALMAAAVTFVFLCAVDLGHPLPASVRFALAVGIASPLWLYARLDTTEAMQGMSLIGATYALLGLRASPTPRRAIAAGAFMGAAVAAKVSNLALVPVFALYAAAISRERALGVAAAFLAPILSVVGGLGALGQAHFGSPFDTGYDLTVERFNYPLLEGIQTLLVSPSFGLLWFWPAALLLPLGALQSARRRPKETTLILIVFAYFLLLHARWWAVWGELWGPRLLMPALPVLSLLLLPLTGAGRRFVRVIFFLALLSGLPVQIVAVSSGFWTHVAPTWRHLRVERAESAFTDPQIAPLRIGFWWLRATQRFVSAGADAADAVLAAPPWRETHPWRDETIALASLRPLLGVDLWAAPSAWRLRRLRTSESGAEIAIPSNPKLRIGLCAGLALLGSLLCWMCRAQPPSLTLDRAVG